jgi:hypothetical protein
MRILGSVLCATVLTLAPAAANAAVVAEWRMDESSGGTMVDSATGVGGTNNGTIYGGVQVGQNPLVSGKAYRFSGTTAYVEVPDASDAFDPGTKNIAVTATVQTVDGPMPDDSYDLVRKGLTTTAGGNWKMEIKRAADPSIGKLLCVFKGVVGGSRVAVQRIANVDVVDGRVHTLKCVKTATSVQAFVDGRTFTTSKAAGSIANDQPVILGAKSASDDVLQGVLDQVTVDIG